MGAIAPAVLVGVEELVDAVLVDAVAIGVREGFSGRPQAHLVPRPNARRDLVLARQPQVGVRGLVYRRVRLEVEPRREGSHGLHRLTAEPREGLRHAGQRDFAGSCRRDDVVLSDALTRTARL